jgi:hypothetical protein
MGVEALLVKIDRVRGRERTVQVTAGLLRSLLALIGLVAGFFALDWLMLGRLVEGAGANRLARGVLLLAMAVTLAYVFIRSVWLALVRKIGDDEVALRVEGRHPELNGRLISTIQLTRDLDEGEYVGSEELIEALEADTVGFAGRIKFTDIIDLGTLKKVTVVAFCFALLSVAMGAWRVDYARALLGRMLLSEKEYPTATRIVFLTPGGVIARGEPYDVTVELDPEGHLPETARLIVRPAAGGDEFEYEMAQPEGSDPGPHGGVVYRGSIERVMEGLEYKVFAHDARSVGWQPLKVLRRPAVRSLELTYTYPAYTGKPVRKTSVGDIRAIQGTEVQIVATLSKPVVSASLQQRHGEDILTPMPMRLDKQKTVATATIRVERDGYYRIELLDANELTSREPVEYAIDVVEDKAPTVRLTFPGRDKVVTRFAMWPLRFEARDDFGIKSGWLRYRITSEADAETETDGTDVRDMPADGFVLEGLVRSQGQREVKAEVPFDLQRLDIRPGQRLVYWIEISDDRTPDPNVGRSRAFEFIVAERDEVMFMIGTAQEEALGRIETIIKKQETTREGVDEIRRKIRRGR